MKKRKKKGKEKEILVMSLMSNIVPGKWLTFYRVANIVLPGQIEAITLFTPRDL